MASSWSPAPSCWCRSGRRAASAWSGTAPVGDTGKAVDPTRSSRRLPASLDVPPLPPSSLRFAEWIARYTLAPLGMVVRMMMSARAVFEPVQAALRRDAWSPARREPPRLTPARKRALEIAADGAIRAKVGAGRARPTARPASSTDWWRPAPSSRWRSPSGACRSPIRAIARPSSSDRAGARRARAARRPSTAAASR